ncbi:unnamed protein product [Diamesa serratosioi]
MEIYVIYGVLFIGFIVVLLKLFKKDRSAEEKPTTSAVNQQQPQSSAVSNKIAKRSNLKKRSDKNNFNHNWLLTTLKSHTGSVLDISFSSNGKYLATSADDRTVLIWYLKELSNAKDRKTFRINVEFDHAYKLVWSPDSKAILVFKAMENTIEVYRVEKKDGIFVNSSKALTFPKAHENEVVSFGIANNGRFIISCTNQTDLILWDVRGNILEQLDTFLMSTYAVKISPCSRFIAACGFACDVKLWEVKFNKSGEYEKILKAFDLTGHNSGVWDFAFDQDSSHLVSVCKDGTFKLFNIHSKYFVIYVCAMVLMELIITVEYEKGESPQCVASGKYDSKGMPALVALSNSAQTIAIGYGTSVCFYSGLTGVLDIVVEKMFNDHITAIEFDTEGKYLFVSGDRQVRIFENITGYKVGIENAQKKLKNQNMATATRDRLELQIEEYEAIINKHE